jgi:hypothetical protein
VTDLTGMDAATGAAYQASLTAIERRRIVRGLGLRTWKQELELSAMAAMSEMAEIGWAAELRRLVAYASADVLLFLRAAELIMTSCRRSCVWSAAVTYCGDGRGWLCWFSEVRLPLPVRTRLAICLSHSRRW